jgi:hypothetical protein
MIPAAAVTFIDSGEVQKLFSNIQEMDGRRRVIMRERITPEGEAD